MLWTIATIQWIISCVLLKRNWRDLFPLRLDFARSYDCVKSQVASAPGQSPCSTEQLCSMPWLLTNPGWLGWSSDPASENVFAQFDIASFMLVILFFFSSAAFVSTPLATIIKRGYALLHPDRCAKGTILGDLGYIDNKLSGPVGAGAVAALVSLCIGALLIGHTPMVWNMLNKEGPVAYDLDCTAVHIIVSPWRQYMDIGYDRALRVIRMWFST